MRVRIAMTVFALGTAPVAGVACGDDDGGGSAEAFCEVQDRIDEAKTFDWDPFNPDFESDADAHLEELDDLESAAVDDLRPDIATLQDFVATFRDAFAGIDRDDDAAIAEAEAAIEPDVVGYDEASDNVARYADDNCA